MSDWLYCIGKYADIGWCDFRELTGLADGVTRAASGLKSMASEPQISTSMSEPFNG